MAHIERRGVDSFLDFSRIQHDQIALDHTGFDLGGTGMLAAMGVSLVNGSTAQTGSPTILYYAEDLSWDRTARVPACRCSHMCI